MCASVCISMSAHRDANKEDTQQRITHCNCVVVAAPALWLLPKLSMSNLTPRFAAMLL